MILILVLLPKHALHVLWGKVLYYIFQLVIPTHHLHLKLFTVIFEYLLLLYLTLYFVILFFYDDYTKYSWTYFMHKKSKVYPYYRIFRAMVSLNSLLPLKIRHLIQGEITKTEFKNSITFYGTLLQSSCRECLNKIEFLKEKIDI